MIKRIDSGSISYLEHLTGSPGWYWGTDWTSGDLYEAEELYRDGHPVRHNRLILVHYPDGKTVEPVSAKDGQYFGRPVWSDGAAVILLADFPAGEIRVLRYDVTSGSLTGIVCLATSEVEDCYNLILHTSPLCLTRQAGDRFQVIWPDRADFPILPSESFCFRDGDLLYFSRWFEDPEYREETVVRRMPDGAVTDQFRGSLIDMPGGEWWLLGD